MVQIKALQSYSDNGSGEDNFTLNFHGKTLQILANQEKLIQTPT